MPLVSIVIPCFNAARWIGETIESALSQDFRDLEVVVVDDGSTDDSAKIIRQFGGRVTFVPQPNRGPCAARNNGLRSAAGTLIQFLDADDLLHQRRIALMLEALQAYPDAPFAGAGYRIFESAVVPGEDIVACPLDRKGAGVRADALTANYLPATGLFKRSFLESVGPWNEQLTRWVDFEYHARIAVLTERPFPYVDLPLYGYRQHDGPRISTHNKAHTNLDGARTSLEEARRQLESRGPLGEREKQWLFPSYVQLARGYAKGGDGARFAKMLRAAASLSPRRAFRIKAVAAQLAAAAFGVRVASQLIERALAPPAGARNG